MLLSNAGFARKLKAVQRQRNAVHGRLRRHPRTHYAVLYYEATDRLSSMNHALERAHEDHGRFTYRDGRRLLIFVVLLIVTWMLLRALVPVLLLFGIVILLAMVLNPLVVKLERHRVPRAV
jgi:Flp pilus assembly protein TadB